MKKAAIYVRCARPSPRGIARQLQRCAEVAKRQGLLLNPDMTFEDDGYSGTSPADQRPGYHRMTEALRSGRVKTLVVDDVMRLSRSVPDLMEILEWLDLVGIRVISAEGQDMVDGRVQRRQWLKQRTVWYAGRPFKADREPASDPRKLHEIAIAIRRATANKDI